MSVTILMICPVPDRGIIGNAKSKVSGRDAKDEKNRNLRLIMSLPEFGS